MARSLATAALTLLAAAATARPDELGGDPCQLASADRARATARQCLACHDGTVAPAVGEAALGGPHGSHPVDLGYDAAAARNRRLHPRFDLSRALALPGGNVACVTCHDGASREPHHTALPMARSAMCLGCHDL